MLALDYGSVRVGLALSDPLRVIATPAGVLKNDGALFAALRTLIVREAVVLVVVGMPYAPDGGAGAKGKEVASFVTKARDLLGVPVETWDESGTSVEARALMLRTGVKKKRRVAKGSVDEIAAAVLLRQYLENHGAE